MLKSFRRNSKQVLEPRRKSVATTASSSTENSNHKSSIAYPGPRTNFFDLPAEIRNTIFEHVAAITEIHLPLQTRKSRQDNNNTPSLLLVSKQVCREYQSLLLGLASIRIIVRNFDFRDLTRVKGSLYSTELKALRTNNNLTIELVAEKPSKDSIALLRRWLVNRSEGLDRLGWRYTIAWPKAMQILPSYTEIRTINVYIQRRVVLNQTLRQMKLLHDMIDETLQFELQPIIEVFELELEKMGPQVDWPTSDMLWPMRARR